MQYTNLFLETSALYTIYQCIFRNIRPMHDLSMYFRNIRAIHDLTMYFPQFQQI